MGRPLSYINLAATAAVFCAGCTYLFYSVDNASSDSISSLRGGGEGHYRPHSRALSLFGFSIGAHSRDPMTVVPKKDPTAVAPGGFPLFADDEPASSTTAEAAEATTCGTPPLQNDYRGTVSTTASGRTCQAWDATSPHAHAFAVPDGPHNHCRNPSDSPGGAWCYTTDPEQRFEHCDIPHCAAAWTPEEHDLFLKGVDWYLQRLPKHEHDYFVTKGRLPEIHFKTIANTIVETRSVAEVSDHFDEWIRTASGPAANTGLPWTEQEEKSFDIGLTAWGPEVFGLKVISWKYVPTRSSDEIRDHLRQVFYGDGAPPAWSDGWSPEEHAAYLEGLSRYAFNKHTQGTAPWKDIAKFMLLRLHYAIGSSGRINSQSVLSHTIEYYRRRGQGEFAPMEVSEWPPDGYSLIAPGTYSRRAPVSYDPMTLGAGAASHAAVAPWGRVLLYISSHFSMQHQMYLKYCWRNVMARSQLLQGADVAVHLTPNDPALRRPAMDLFGDVFADHNLMMFVRDYQGVELRGGMDRLVTKKTGAVMTMYEAVNYNYFEGYDWVIRVNPDVLLRDDSWFREAMSDPSLSALIVNCHEGKKDVHLHTDFFVVKPEVLLEEAFPRYIVAGGAEGAFTAALTETVLKSDPPNYAWVPDADPMSKKTCRVGEGRDFSDSPVVHEHQLHPEVCTVPQEDTKMVNAAFQGH